LIELLYGKKSVKIKLENKFDTITIPNTEKSISEKNFKEKLLIFFKEAKYDFTKIAIVIADKTRKCDYAEDLPVLVNTLESLGAEHDSITFYIAYGTHPLQTESESLESYGEIFNKYKFIHHDCTKKEVFKFFGKTRRGTDIAYRKDILNSTFRITFGVLSHHYFAGFGGGRKLIFPGLGYKHSIYNNHSLFLDKTNDRLHKNCQPGILKENPLAEDLKEATDLLKINLSIHGIINTKSEVIDLILGKTYADFEQACKKHEETTSFKIKKRYDTVIASCGGFPKDINFIQVHKSIHYASDFVKDGGKLYLFAECRDGIGSETFLPWFEEKSFKAAFEKLKKNYSGNGGTALSLMTIEKRITINLYTELNDKICKKIGITKIKNPNLSKAVKAGQNVLIIPTASITVKTKQ